MATQLSLRAFLSLVGSSNSSLCDFVRPVRGVENNDVREGTKSLTVGQGATIQFRWQNDEEKEQNCWSAALHPLQVTFKCPDINDDVIQRARDLMTLRLHDFCQLATAVLCHCTSNDKKFSSLEVQCQPEDVRQLLCSKFGDATSSNGVLSFFAKFGLACLRAIRGDTGESAGCPAVVVYDSSRSRFQLLTESAHRDSDVTCVLFRETEVRLHHLQRVKNKPNGAIFTPKFGKQITAGDTCCVQNFAQLMAGEGDNCCFLPCQTTLWLLDSNSFSSQFEEVAKEFIDHCLTEELSREAGLTAQLLTAADKDKLMTRLALLQVMCYNQDDEGYDNSIQMKLRRLLEENFGENVRNGTDPEVEEPQLTAEPGCRRCWRVASECQLKLLLPSHFALGPLLGILLLIFYDAVASFPREMHQAPLKLPCLLKLFRMSRENDKNQLPAMLGEYLALLREYMRDVTRYDVYEPVCSTFDFRMQQRIDGNWIDFSVKSFNCRRLKFLRLSRGDASLNCRGSMRLMNSNDGVNLILCNCCICCKNRTVHTAVDQTCDSHSWIGDLANDNGYHDNTFLVSAFVLFELRFAITGFQMKGYPLKQNLIEYCRDLCEVR